MSYVRLSNGKLIFWRQNMGGPAISVAWEQHVSHQIKRLTPSMQKTLALWAFRYDHGCEPADPELKRQALMPYLREVQENSQDKGGSQ